MKNLFKKKVKPKVTLSEVISNHLRRAGFNTEKDRFSDNISNWVAIKKNGYTLTIEFDTSGNVIKDVELHKDILQVVDQEKLF